MSSLQLFPEVIDGSSLAARQTSPLALPIGIEGQKDVAGTGVIGQVYTIARGSEADTWFGPASSLSTLIKFVLDRGAGPVYAAASASATTPTLVQRQAAWQNLEARREIRIRLTDSTTQADLVGIATSCDNANLMSNKQFAIVGMPAATSKANLITAATAITSKRVCLVGPAVYDQLGVLKTGAFLAAAIAAMVALNTDITDDLDTATIPNLTAMEKDASGNDVFREIVVTGTLQNDFEDLLQGGVSPAMPGLDGGVAISHLRMTYKTDSTFDALMTRIIMDQLFVLVRDYAIRFMTLRKQNTDRTRSQLASGVTALLTGLNQVVNPVTQGDGTKTYGVTVTPSANVRQMILSYQGEVIRGVQTLLVAPTLTIPV